MPAKAKPPTGTWLQDQRRALGLTSEALAVALGANVATIRAVEAGDHILTQRLRDRAVKYFAKELLRDRGPIPPDGLVRVEVWVRPETLTAAIAEAKRRDVDLERVLGEWTDRPR